MISIITTCYNREAYIAQTIQSVLDQTHEDFELIIWDDGSTDGSLEIAQAYAKKDDRIKVIAATHQGHVTSAQGAISLSKGEYFGCVDSDDYLAPTCLEQTKKVLDNNPNIGVVYTWYGRVDALDNFLGIGHRCEIPYSSEQLLTSHIAFHFRLIRREVYNNIGGLNTNYEYASDYDLCLRLSEITEFLQLPKLLYFYREHPYSMGNTSNGLQLQHAWNAISEAMQRRGLDCSHFAKPINTYI